MPGDRRGNEGSPAVTADRTDCQGKLFSERRWLADAGPQGPAAAGSAVFRANAEVTVRLRWMLIFAFLEPLRG
jgi:hypothetical protein